MMFVGLWEEKSCGAKNLKNPFCGLSQNEGKNSSCGYSDNL